MMSQHQFPHLTLSQLLSQKWLPDDVGTIDVKGLRLDHREIKVGEVFIAVAGVETDGRKYIDAAIENGAVAVLADAESENETVRWQGAVPVVPHLGLGQFVSEIAGNFYGNPSRKMSCFGVTGTNGKSTCTHLLAQLLTRLGQPSSVMGTLGYGKLGGNNSDVLALQTTGKTTADAIATQSILSKLAEEGAENICMEVSSHGLVQHRVKDVDFKTVIFTNLSRDHLDYHGTMESYGKAKQLLLNRPELEHRIINWDDEYGRYLSSINHMNARTWTFSIDDPAAHIYAKSITRNLNGTRAEIESVWGKGVLETQLIGDFNLSNLMSVIVAACVHGFELQSVLAACSSLRSVPGRMEKVEGVSSLNVVVDYAHTPDGLENALNALRGHTKNKLICLFGCGGDRDKGKRPEMAKIAEQFADTVVVTSDNPRSESPEQIIADIHSGFSDLSKIVEIEDRADAIQFCVTSAQAGDSVLIAGKGHEEYQFIGSDRLLFSDVKQVRLALRQKNRPIN